MNRDATRLTREDLTWRPPIPAEDLSWDQIERIDQRLRVLNGANRVFHPLGTRSEVGEEMHRKQVDEAYQALGRACYRMFAYSGAPHELRRILSKRSIWALPRTRKRCRFIVSMWDFSLGWEFDQWLEHLLTKADQNLDSVCEYVRGNLPINQFLQPPQGLFSGETHGAPGYYIDFIQRWCFMRGADEADDIVAVMTYTNILDGAGLRQWLLPDVSIFRVRKTLHSAQHFRWGP